MPALIVRIKVARAGDVAKGLLPRLDAEIALQLTYISTARSKGDPTSSGRISQPRMYNSASSASSRQAFSGFPNMPMSIPGSSAFSSDLTIKQHWLLAVLIDLPPEPSLESTAVSGVALLL